jgi:MoaA/NifB/PqqE/SkfB family radical SAM enzyme
MSVTLTGGEPLSHPEFFDIARAVRARAMAVRIFTNGSLIDDEAAREIAALHPQAVEVSLHGATAATHDRTTGRPGSFDTLWRGIERVQAHKVRLFVKCPLTNWNEHELEGMIALVKGQGLPFHVDPSLTPRDDGDLSPLSYMPSAVAVAWLMRQGEVSHSLKPIQREAGAVNCGLGRLTLAIDPEGNVFPCIQWRQKALGNVREMRLAAMWHSSPERLEVARVAIDANSVMMAAGGPIAEFPFCPAIALQRGGDPLTPDDGFARQATLAGDIRRELGL